MIENRVVAYEPNFDRVAYINARGEDRERLNNYTRRQVETHLGERFNVLLSTTRYEIKDGQIFGENMDEPFIEVLVNGRNYRRLHGEPIDYAREDAEVFGFAKIESTLVSQDSPIGLMMLSVSQRGKEGSIYKHNFYDIFTAKEDETGGRYIEARRYSSGLSLGETVEKLKTAGLLPKEANPTTEEFLANPIVINPEASLFDTAERVHEYLHRDHQYVSRETYDRARQMVHNLIEGYTRSLDEDPYNIRAHNLYLNAVFNGFDMAMEAIDGQDVASTDALQIYALQIMLNSRNAAGVLGDKPVREVSTGCGLSVGSESESPFSVSEFGLEPDNYGKRTFECPNKPACGKTITRPKNKLISNCPHCGRDVRC